MSFAPPERDIDHNRRGRLSPEQVAYLANHRKMARAGYVLLVLVIGLGAGGSALTTAFQRGEGIGTALLAGGVGVAILAGTALGCFYLWRRTSAPARQDVTVVDGRVVWAGSPKPYASCWLPVGADGIPLSLSQPLPILPPGPYRFYVHDGYLVGAESPLDATTHYSITRCWSAVDMSAARRPLPPLPVGDPGALHAALATTMGFTWDDLQHHRHGMLSPRQGVGRVFVVEGPLSFGWTMRSRSSVTYWWEVGGRRLEIPLPWLWLAPLDLVYRCYVDEHSQRILSMEPVIVQPVP